MVHPVAHRDTIFRHRYGVSDAAHERMEVFLEIWYIVASVLFVTGSVEFLPGTEVAERRGCRMFDVGSIMYAAGSTLYLADLFYLNHAGKRCPRREVMEQLLYVIGSFIFMAGCLIWDPSFIETFVAESGREKHWWYCCADITFLIGSLMFAVAAFLSALSIKHVHPEVEKFALGILACYEFGGLLFVAGTMGFTGPGFYGCGHDMQMLGTIFYVVGSALYLTGTALSLMKTLVHHQLVRERHAQLEEGRRHGRCEEAEQADSALQPQRVAVDDDALGSAWERLRRRTEEHAEATRSLHESLAARARAAGLRGGAASERRLLEGLAGELRGAAEQAAAILEEDARLLERARGGDGFAPHGRRPHHHAPGGGGGPSDGVGPGEEGTPCKGLDRRSSSLLWSPSNARPSRGLTGVLSSSFGDVLRRSWLRLVRPNLDRGPQAGYVSHEEDSDTESRSDGSP